MINSFLAGLQTSKHLVAYSILVFALAACTFGDDEVDGIGAPSFSPEPGTYDAPVDVTIVGDGLSHIYYTLNGRPPTINSTLFADDPIHISRTTTVTAIAFGVKKNEGYISDPDHASETRLATYIIAGSCDPEACLNGGTCESAPDGGAPGDCSCPAGFSGPLCEDEEPVDPCDPNPCMNGGTCTADESDDAFACACIGGYTGTTCHRAPDMPITTTVHGRVFDEDGAPVDAATVRVVSLSSSVPFTGSTSTSAGGYSLNNVPAGVSLSFAVSKTGYTWRGQVQVAVSNLAGDPSANTFDFNAYTIRSLDVTATRTNIDEGDTEALTATVTYSDGPSAGVTAMASWMSSAPSVASVGAATGLVTGVEAGTATITATYTDGTHMALNSIELRVDSLLAVPAGLAYTYPNASYRIGSPITDNTPASTGGPVDSYAISPVLPAGLMFDTTLGVISGTPTALIGRRTYTVTATNAAGMTTATVDLDVNCQTGFVRVPHDPAGVYTTEDFCLAKYIASAPAVEDLSGAARSVPGAVPWTTIEFSSARTACQNMGSGYDLVTNDEWQTVARNVELVASNWSLGHVADRSSTDMLEITNLLNRGKSDGSVGGYVPVAASADDNESCSETESVCDLATWSIDRRTFALDTGDVVWDLAGNVWQWVHEENIPATSYSYTGYMMYVTELDDSAVKAAYGPSGEYDFLSALSPYGGLGYGELFFLPREGIFRGGSLYSGAPYQGIFAVRTDKALSYANSIYGFRCAYHP